MDAPTAAAPAVVAVMVTSNPGDWFDDVLASLAAQDYPALTTVVIDAHSDVDPTERIGRVLPGAYVKRLENNPGYGAAANEILGLVEGAAFFAFCHDDVALAPDAIRQLLEESYRSNAAIVGPKLVEWDAPTTLQSVGFSIDKAGVTSPFVEPGERDQEQLDGVRDVFYVSGACLVARADLFAALGGFDPAITLVGEDLDLCWRAHCAGARVLVVPSAVVRHRRGLAERRADVSIDKLTANHRLRAVLTNYSVVHLIRVLPQAVLYTFIEAVYNVVAGRPRRAAAVVGAWWSNLAHAGSIVQRRAVNRPLRSVSDSEVRDLQVGGSARVRHFIKQLRNSDDPESTGGVGKRISGNLRTGVRRTPVLVWGIITVLILLGLRSALRGNIANFNEFAPYPKTSGILVREYISGWRTVGFGTAQAAPTGLLLLGVWGWLFLGALGLARAVLIFGCIPLGLVGMWRLTRPLPSRRARSVALALYAATPVPYNAFARGSWAGMVGFAIMPWVIGRLGRASWLAPFVPDDAAPVRLRFGLRMSVSLGLIVAFGAAVSPMFVFLVPFVAFCILVGSVLTGSWRAAIRGMSVSIGASVVAFILHMPWSLTFLNSRASWDLLGGVPHREAGRSFLQILRFQTGPMGAGILGFALLAAGILPMIVGKGWRLEWATRLWSVAAGSFALAVASEQGWIHRSLGSTELLLAPAAVALAYLGALGLAAFELDLPGYRFGWRQAAVAVTAIAACLAFLPPLAAIRDGRWGSPTLDHHQTLKFLDTAASNASGDDLVGRVLWIGDPESLPAAGWRLSPGIAYAITTNRVGDLRDRWASPAPLANDVVPAALALAVEGRTRRIGQLLAPMGIRYVALVQSPSPSLEQAKTLVLPSTILTSMADQLDLKAVPVDDAITMYDNLAAVPTNSVFAAGSPGLVSASRPWSDFPAGRAALDPHPAQGSLTGTFDGEGRNFVGLVSAGSIVHTGVTADDGWHLLRAGIEQRPIVTYGYSTGFAIDDTSGPAELSYTTPKQRYLWIAAQVALWALALAYGCRRGRDTRKRETAVAAEVVDEN